MSCGQGVTCGDVIVSLAHDVFNLFNYTHGIVPSAYGSGRSLMLLNNYEAEISNGTFVGIKNFNSKIRNKLRDYIDNNFVDNPTSYKTKVYDPRTPVGCLCSDYVRQVGWETTSSDSFTLSVLGNDIFLDEYFHPFVLWAKYKNYGKCSIPRNMYWTPTINVDQADVPENAFKFFYNGSKSVLFCANAATNEAQQIRNAPLNNFYMIDVNPTFTTQTAYGAAGATVGLETIALISPTMGTRNIHNITGRIVFGEDQALAGAPAARNFVVNITGRLIPNNVGDYFKMTFNQTRPQSQHYLPLLGLIQSAVDELGNSMVTSWMSLLDNLNRGRYFADNAIPERFTNLNASQLFGGNFFAEINNDEGIFNNKVGLFRREVMSWYIQAVSLLTIAFATSDCCI